MMLLRQAHCQVRKKLAELGTKRSILQFQIFTPLVEAFRLSAGLNGKTAASNASDEVLPGQGP